MILSISLTAPMLKMLVFAVHLPVCLFTTDTYYCIITVTCAFNRNAIYSCILRRLIKTSFLYSSLCTTKILEGVSYLYSHPVSNHTLTRALNGFNLLVVTRYLSDYYLDTYGFSRACLLQQ